MKITLIPLKFLKILLILISINSTYAFQQSSKIDAVTVYLDGAEINRIASVELNSGKSEITFNDLSSYIEESSIQISGLQKTSILSINYGINYLSKKKQSDSILTLQTK
ncbi:DUF4140 domain-containing protein [Winogradskyella wichelsiae]|uniref:DUF4140 domain-containing protein n=1 Tax=Winogradskyella wichelsiae TaxID=2697007 RepID=UPI003EF69738